MFVRAGIIVIGVIPRFATARPAFAALLPLIGHAAWRAYRGTIDAPARPARRVAGDTV
ncbi:MAG: hypothetical protein QGH58_03485 [Arenicellales bacterium]|nr:hypothetical protein [Arenicellales bacterium]MDP6551535.1 hypothetical protein [Arenicellales bacterium]MDP6790951.1 hypothetical protein [Arenicellales bacterium]MDP6918497.1 hypothetical protein [Arenicellales bacterium]